VGKEMKGKGELSDRFILMTMAEKVIYLIELAESCLQYTPPFFMKTVSCSWTVTLLM
jgi:hypothetical protein